MVFEIVKLANTSPDKTVPSACSSAGLLSQLSPCIPSSSLLTPLLPTPSSLHSSTALHRLCSRTLRRGSGASPSGSNSLPSPLALSPPAHPSPNALSTIPPLTISPPSLPLYVTPPPSLLLPLSAPLPSLQASSILPQPSGPFLPQHPPTCSPPKTFSGPPRAIWTALRDFSGGGLNRRGPLEGP